MEARAGAIAFRGILMAVAASGIAPERQQTAALYLLVTGCNLPGAVAGEVAGCTKQNVSKLLRKVEDRRDDAVFDQALASLERQLFREV